MSRLDAVAALLGTDRDGARRFLRKVRDEFKEAPSYAQVLHAIKDHRGKPSPQQVAAMIKRYQKERGISTTTRTAPRSEPGRPGRRPEQKRKRKR